MSAAPPSGGAGPALRRAGYALLSILVLLADQATKAIVTAHLDPHTSVPVVPGLFHLTLVTNRGALFGLFHDLPDPVRAVVFTTVPVLAIALILTFQCRTAVDDRVAQTGLALILGGAVGNLVDRVRFGHVIDFLDLFIGAHHWPAFNVADSCICAGVALLVLDLLVRGRARAGALPPEA